MVFNRYQLLVRLLVGLKYALKSVANNFKFVGCSFNALLHPLDARII